MACIKLEAVERAPSPWLRDQSLQSTAQSSLKITLGLKAFLEDTKQQHFLQHGFALEKFYRPMRKKQESPELIDLEGRVQKRGGCRANS